MKLTHFLSLIALVLSTSLLSFGQQNAAKAISADNFVSENKEGLFLFEVPSSITEKDVASSAEYYTMYFSVTFDANNHQTLIRMKDMDENSKHIIIRFFISLGLREIDYNGTIYEPEDFYQKFLRNK